MLLDFLIIVIILLGAGYGLVRGGIKQIFSILGIVLGIGMAVLFTKRIAVALGFGDQTLALIILFIAIFCVSFIVVMLLGKTLRKIMHLMLLGMVDQLIGLVIGVIKGYIAAWILTLLFFYFKPEWFLSSKFGSIVVDIGKLFIGEILKKG